MSSRPKGCQGCRKKVATSYRKIIDGKVEEMCACAKCPKIDANIRGDKLTAAPSGPIKEEENFACENCKTKLSDIKEGKPLGCPECYSTFEEVIKVYLGACDRIKESKVIRTLEGESLHVGKSPFGDESEELRSRLSNLNDALNEALKIENYEQAAWLRDRIKTITESVNEEQAS
ncbi:MAG: UvrB/UvrC motif-containing protein [Simkaniaceae bacterium]|nr:UvrB/UvrC motif-containing protein [Simkaniaceae bacterium]